jgi:hypothetical protein
MATLDEAFPGQWLKAENLGRRPHIVIINVVTKEMVGSGSNREQKYIAAFRGKTKRLILNKTNFKSVAKITGKPNSNDWVGARVELYPTLTLVGDEEVPCIRIRAPSNPSPNAAHPEPAPLAPTIDDFVDDQSVSGINDINDEIAF